MYKNDKIGLNEYFKRLLQNSTSENDTDIDSDDLNKEKLFFQIKI